MHAHIKQILGGFRKNGNNEAAEAFNQRSGMEGRVRKSTLHDAGIKEKCG